MAEFVCKALSPSYDWTPVSGKGVNVFKEDGTSYMDFQSTMITHSCGHSHPRIIEAVKKQIELDTHLQPEIALAPPVRTFLTKLAQVVPKGLDRFALSVTGSECVENAIKLARAYTGKQNVISFMGAYHGYLMGTNQFSANSTARKIQFGPFMPGVYHAPFPHFTGNHDADSQWYLDQLNMVLKTLTAPEDTAAILLEPLQGEGCLMATKAFMQGLRDICTQNKIMLIADEIQTGMGRTGLYWGMQHYGVTPDIMCIGKGVASGYPMSVVAMKREIGDFDFKGHLGSTFIGNLLSMAAASTVIDIIKDEGLVANAAERGEQMRKRLGELKQNANYHIKCLHGAGCFIGCEFDLDEDKVSDINSKCLERGLMLSKASNRRIISFKPPLIVSGAEVDKALGIFAQVLQTVLGK